ncbi:MAG TPA: thiamine-phosphate kinase [Propionibacteriaceae bacterium]|nr:thiamine-phosphate kinase [Propionibacteriaceae bacterium]
MAATSELRHQQGTSSGAETLADVGEFGLIARLTQGLVMPPAVSVGPGDDAAVFLVNGSAVCSTDVLVEGVHFRRDWSSAHDIGRKCVAVNVSDLEAMGATPVTLVVAFSAPPDLPTQWAREFMTGLRQEADLAGVALVGGDMARGRVITIAVTVVGETQGRAPVRRSGAHIGDIVAVKGLLGWSGAGLSVLGRGFRSPRAVVEAHRVPRTPYGSGRTAALAGATAMVDISDGLVADLGHVCRASEVGIDLDTARLVIDEPLRVVGQATGRDPLTFVLAGGEDHALAATFPPGSVPEDWVVIGRVVDPTPLGGPCVLVDGERPDVAGWDHFGA